MLIIYFNQFYIKIHQKEMKAILLLIGAVVAEDPPADVNASYTRCSPKD